MNIQKKSLLATLFIAVALTVPATAQDIASALKDLKSERYVKAEQTFNLLATNTPSAENQYYLGYYLLKTNQPDKAKAAFEKGAAADPANQLNNLGLAGVALAKKDLATAKTLIDNVVKATKSKNMDILLKAGETYTAFDVNGQNDPAEALRLLDLADKLDKKNTSAEIEMAMGDAYFVKNDGGNAVGKYENALLINPNLAEANYKIGRVYLRGKNYKLAQEFYEKAIANDPEFAPTYRSYADALANSRAYKKASKMYNTYVEKTGTTNEELLLDVAKYYFLAGDYLQATNYLDKLKGKVTNPIINRMYGWSYAGLNKNEQAVEALEKFIKNAPEKVIYDDYKYLGRAYGQLGTPEGDSLGVVNLTKAAPSDTLENLYREIGAKYYGAKRWDKASDFYKQAIANDKKPLASDYTNLGLAYYQVAPRLVREVPATDTARVKQVRKEVYMRADSVFSKLAERNPEYATAYYYRGNSNYYANPTESVASGLSVPFYEKFIELASKDIAADASKQTTYSRNLITSYKYLAQYNIAKKDDVKAKEYIAKVLELDPNDKDAKAFMEGPKPPATPTPPTPATPGAKPTTPKAPVKKTTK
jgi:tetratricopeptide (TPR) repeat protein